MNSGSSPVAAQCFQNPTVFAVQELVPMFCLGDDNSRWKLIHTQCFLNTVMLMLRRNM